MRMSMSRKSPEATVEKQPEQRKSLLGRLRRSSQSPRKSLFKKRWKRSSTTGNTANGKESGESSTSSSIVRVPQDEDREGPPPVTIRTSVLGSYEPLEEEELTKPDQLSEASVVPKPSCATAVLQHSFVLCGALDQVDDQDLDANMMKLPEDPTVQESFECVFASQLEDGMTLDALWEEEAEGAYTAGSTKDLVSPAQFNQSILRSRSSNSSIDDKILGRPRQTFRTGMLVHIGTYDPIRDRMTLSPPKASGDGPEETTTVMSPPPPTCCARCSAGLYAPMIPPEDWPQRPLLLRPTPGSGMVVKKVRLVSGLDLWNPEDEASWTETLQQHWGKRNVLSTVPSSCPECMVLPINNGNEVNGESLLIDFETPIFEGTMMLRLRHSEGTTPEPYDDTKGYFAGLNRRYQVVVQGRPKRELVMTKLLTGFQLQKPCGKLPPRWILKGAIKVLSFFAPQMQVDLDGQKPTSYTPLGSQPQMLRVCEPDAALNLETKQEEPCCKEESIVDVASDAPTTLARAKFRKKTFDKLYAAQDESLTMDPNKVYTFEFLQHLLNFNDFSIELGSMLGSVSLQEMLNGQALQIMACHAETGERLWSFDVFHEDLYKDALRHDQKQ